MIRIVLFAGAVVTAALFGSPYCTADDKPRIGVSSAAGPLGATPYTRGKWGVMRIDLVNRSDRDADVEVLSSAKTMPHRQFGRTVWLPPRSRRVSWYPFHFPANHPAETRQVKINSVVWDRTDGKRELVKTTVGRRLHDSVVRLASGRRITAIISTSDNSRPNKFAERGVIAAKASRLRSRNAIYFDDFLPTTVESLDGVNQLAITNDRIASDETALSTVRQWVQRGGRLWIMLDVTRPETIDALLADAKPFQEVDRVELTDLKLVSADRRQYGVDSSVRNFEQPIRLVRVLADGVETTFTVNGWPAGFWQTYGRGRILYTTLGMRGWLRRAEEQDAEIRRLGLPYAPLPQLDNTAAELFITQKPQAPPSDLFDEYLAGQIGYETVGSATVGLVLGGFCLALLLAALWLARRRLLDRMLWFTPTAAVIAAAALFALGMQSRRSVEETVAVAQLVDVEPGSEELVFSGRLAVYAQGRTTKSVSTNRGGRIDPELAEQVGTNRETVATDFERWIWKEVAIPAGVNLASFQYERPAPTPIRAAGRLGPDGFSGRLRVAPFEDPADAVIAGMAPFPLGVRLDSDGTLTASAGDALGPGNYISGTLLSDEQRRRQEVYRKLLKTTKGRHNANKPTLFVWTRALPMGFDFGEVRRSGSALLAIPLRIERTPPDTAVRIPAVFLPYRRVLGPSKRAETPAYSNLDSGWIEREGPTKTWLRIQLPPQVVPFGAAKLIATVRFESPQRPFQIAGVVDGKPVIVASVDEPLAQTRVEIDRADALRLDAAGGLLIGVFIGGKKTPGRPWKLAGVRFESEGRTAAK